jgi:hypothetical protein
MRNAYNILVGIPERKRQLGRPRVRWEDSIIMDIGEIGWEGVGGMRLTRDRDQWLSLLNTMMNILVL